MSVNVDLDIRIRGFGANKKAVVKQVAELLSGEDLLDQLDKADGKDEVRFASDAPLIIAKAYAYLPALGQRLGALATGGVVIELRSRTEGGPWQVDRAGTSAKPAGKLSVTGKTVVLTGELTGIGRRDATAKLEKLGARVTGSVSKHTDYVFAGHGAGEKKDAAERLGVPVLGEAELFALIGAPKVKAKAPVRVSAGAKDKVAARKPKVAVGFHGKTVVITGTLSMERADVARLLEAAGAKVTGSVSANTHYLVAGAGVGATKLGEASALGVTVIDEATLTEMLRA